MTEYPTWSPEQIAYTFGDIVDYQGKTYKCVAGHESTPFDWYTPGKQIESAWEPVDGIVSSATQQAKPVSKKKPKATAVPKPPVPSVEINEWSGDAVAYQTGDIVEYKGGYYQRRYIHESEPWEWNLPNTNGSPWIHIKIESGVITPLEQA